MKKEKKVRASICSKCGSVLPRKRGEKPALCQCGAQMKKAKMFAAQIKKGKLTLDELPAGDAHPKDPERNSRIKKFMNKEASPEEMYQNYRIYLMSSRFPDLEKWWELVFPKETFPNNKPWMLIALRIEYYLAGKKHASDGKAVSSKFLINYNAVMDLDMTKVSESIKNIITVYESSRLKRLDREEEKLVKANKD